MSPCIWLFKTNMTFLYIFAICHLFTIRSLVITLTIYSLRNIWLHISHLPFDIFTLPFVCHLTHSHCHLFAIHLKFTVKAFTLKNIWLHIYIDMAFTFSFETYGCTYFICLFILTDKMSFHLPFDLPFSWTHTCHSLFIWLCHYMAFTQWLWHALFLVGTYGLHSHLPFGYVR